jgi:hypothetical protein
MQILSFIGLVSVTSMGTSIANNYGVNIQITYISAFQVPQKAEI